MLDHNELLLALRTNLLAIEVASTGTMVLEATVDGFVRAAGDFTTEGFEAGMEVVPAGFTSNTIDNILAVTSSKITVENARSAEASAGGRSLLVEMPETQAAENEEKKRKARRWFMWEEYIFGPGVVIGAGAGSKVEYAPMYIVHIEALSNTGATAIIDVVEAILAAFPPMLAFTLANSDIVRVRTDPTPFASQPVSRNTGAPESVITIPLIARTSNPI